MGQNIFSLYVETNMSSSILPLFPNQPEAVPSEIIYSDATGHVTGTRETATVRPANGTTFSESNPTIQFDISPISGKAIDLSTLYFSYFHSVASDGNRAVMDEGAYSPIEQLTVRTASGVPLSSIKEYSRLCAFLSDATMDPQLRASSWHLGYGPDATRPPLGRQYYCHMKGLFDQTQKWIYPAMFGGLTVEIKLKAGSQFHHSTGAPAGNISYVLSNVHMDFETVALPANIVESLMKKAAGDGVKMLLSSYQYTPLTLGTETQTILTIGNRNRSQKCFIATFQEQALALNPSAVTQEKTSTRSAAGIVSWQLRNGTSYLPQEPVTRPEKAYLELSKAMHHNTRGTLDFATFSSSKFAIVRSLQVCGSQLSGSSDSAVNAQNLDLILNRVDGAAPARCDVWVQHDVVVEVKGTTCTVYS